MSILFINRKLYIGVVATIIVLILLMIYGVRSRDTMEQVTAVVEVGPVRELVSVSGIAKAKQTAELAFPTGGIIESVTAVIGDKVEVGDILVTLDSRALYADRQEAVAAVAKAVADRDELIAGPTDLARFVTTETIASKETALETTRENEAQKIANAYKDLLSSDLAAYSKNVNEDSVPPTISGTYACDEEGEYVLDVFSSAAQSGYSYRLTGLETGTYTVSTEQPVPIGDCGLRAEFDPSSSYSNTEWVIEIPNTASPLYVANRNAYTLAITQAESAIFVAEQAVALSEADAANQNSPARNEALARADAAVSQAQARLSRVDTAIADKILRAPFAGTITEIDILPGETVTNAPVVTLLANDEFDVTARIPEIDIGKLLLGQKAEMVFDARSTETVIGEISYISLKAIEIDGVSYYEATIKLDELPTWIRSGLNADIEIIVNEQSDVLRIPKRFIIETNVGTSVLLKRGDATATSTVEILLSGNDGYVAITGLNEGDILVSP